MATSVKLSNGNYIDSAGIWDATSKKTLETALSILLADGAGAHNSLYRGKYLGTAVTTAQWAAIKAGTFTDLYIGDYWTINSVNWRIAAFDYYYNAGDTVCAVHHAVIVPDTNLYNAQFETTNTTANGYYGSQLKQSGLATALTTIGNAFGSGHILEHRNYFCNACNTSTGRPSAGAWYNTKVDIMTEEMVYGTRVFGTGNPGGISPWAEGHYYNIDYCQLPLFALDKPKICNRSWYWLRNPASSAIFAGVRNDGGASYGSASNSNGVRPAFCIYQS